jgi:hypothetical protein
LLPAETRKLVAITSVRLLVAMESTLSAREQLPAALRRVDDPWGLTWRAVNLSRRLSVRRAARFAIGYARGVGHERPVFVLGAPRSGTSMLFQVLRSSRELGALAGEGHDIWRALHHPRWGGWRSDAVQTARPGERRFVSARFFAHFDEVRFVEKTPDNSLRVPYLLELFPDALFLEIRRNPCDVISSLIDGWREPTGRYRSYFVPERLSIPDHPHPHQWRFALIEGWRDYLSRPVEEIAFAQWDQCSHALAKARASVHVERWHEVHLEDLLAGSPTTLPEICRAAQITCDQQLEERLAELRRRPVNALSPPLEEKWRQRNPDEIRKLLPRIAADARGRGYEIDPETGSFELERGAAARATRVGAI